MAFWNLQRLLQPRILSRVFFSTFLWDVLVIVQSNVLPGRFAHWLNLPGGKPLKTWTSSKHKKNNIQNHISFSSSDSITWRLCFAGIAAGTWGAGDCEPRTIVHLLNTPSEKEFEAGWLKPVLVVVHRDVLRYGWIVSAYTFHCLSTAWALANRKRTSFVALQKLLGSFRLA